MLEYEEIIRTQSVSDIDGILTSKLQNVISFCQEGNGLLFLCKNGGKNKMNGPLFLYWNLEVLIFEQREKPENPEKNLSEQSREPTTNSAHI